MRTVRAGRLGGLLLAACGSVALAAPKATFTTSGKVIFCSPGAAAGCPAGDDHDYIVLSGAVPCRKKCGPGASDAYIHYPQGEAAGFPKTGKLTHQAFMLSFGSAQLPASAFYRDASNTMYPFEPVIVITRSAGRASYTLTAPRSILH